MQSLQADLVLDYLLVGDEPCRHGDDRVAYQLFRSNAANLKQRNIYTYIHIVCRTVCAITEQLSLAFSVLTLYISKAQSRSVVFLSPSPKTTSFLQGLVRTSQRPKLASAET